MRLSLSLISFCASLALPALAGEHPRIHIYGPKGCSFLDGIGGDGAAFHALDDDHLILDHWVMEGTQISCRFDDAFSLMGAPGKEETQTGSCTNADGDERRGTFTLTYSDADHASLEISDFDQAVPFTACDRP